MSIVTGSSLVLLRPRPLETVSGSLLLLPLLPTKVPPKALPLEVWEKILLYVLDRDIDNPGPPILGVTKPVGGSRVDILLVCKGLKNTALPLFYNHARITSLASLEKFAALLHAADQSWDSLRRIPYSAPGRWVQTLDLSMLNCALRAEACRIDSLLTRLFTILPFLTRYILNPSIVLSRPATTALSCKEGISNLQVLKGMKGLLSARSITAIDEEPLVQVLRVCPKLTQLEVIGPGVESIDLDEPEVLDLTLPSDFVPLHLPNLHTLTILSTHSSPLLFALLHSPLPSLRDLTVTPYDDVPYPTSLVSHFIDTHGTYLRHLNLFTPKVWPHKRYTSPPTLLLTSPHVKHLSLESPLPHLTLTSNSASITTHPVQVLSIPRPDSQFLALLERILPALPSLKAVRTRDARWLKKGISSRALEAGVQGELREWRRRLGRHGIRILDADWTEYVEVGPIGMRRQK
ncbi:hypothetical protein JAAARDRAFT_147144 [Jaapia argillacea MUCL 33604]|uniref:F-box domain-containing protein n=1 Tax=Jaapia argillacea MUCL 33604 TaxID=933084 RepID=A0A067Q7X0_9AGAM|nr:hypothetical protein JAAARDRAFT_147144 [Jaapia argillacea MUCL 33604]